MTNHTVVHTTRVRWFFPPTVLLTTILFTHAANGQPVMPDGSATPENAIYDVDANVPWAVWVAYDGFSPLKLPDKDSVAAWPGTTKAALPFMERCFFVAKYQPRGQSVYYLIGSDDGPKGPTGKVQVPRDRQFGWIPEEFLVLSSQAKQVESVSEDGSKLRIQGFHRKAILVNTTDTLKQDRQYIDKVVVRLAPTEQGRPRLQVSLFTLFFIFGETEDRVLIGNNPTFLNGPIGPDEEYAPSSIVLGWVPRRRMEEWNTREALFWDRESTLQSPRRIAEGRLWRAPIDAYAANRDIWQDLSRVDIPSGYTPVFVSAENIDAKTGESPAVAYDTMRFPILDWTPDEQFPGLAGNWQLYRVGVLGSFVGADGQSIASAERVREYQQAISRLTGQLALTEILFVIDDTSSMKPWFRNTASAIQGILDRVRSAAEETSNVRIAVAFYNDLDQNNPSHPGYTTMPLVSVGTSVDRLVASVQDHTESGGGGSPREMVLPGISAAIENAGFQKHSQKFVVVIGDAGDRGGGPSPSVVGKSLAVLAPDIRFLAVHVPDPSLIERDGDMKEFRDNMLRIVAELKKYPDARAAYENVSSRDRFLKLIDDAYRQLRDDVKRAQEAADDAKVGVRPPTRLAAALEKEFEGDSAMLALIDNLKKQTGVQLFQKGYIWHYKGVDPLENRRCSVRPVLLLSAAEVATMRDLLRALKLPKESVRSATPYNVVQSAIKTQAGENPPEGLTAVAAFNLDPKALKVGSRLLIDPPTRSTNPRQVILDQKEVLELYHKGDLLDDAYKEIARSYARKEFSWNGEKHIEWIPKDDPNDRHDDPQATPRKWTVPGIKAPIEWLWIDQEKEWP